MYYKNSFIMTNTRTPTRDSYSSEIPKIKFWKKYEEHQKRMNRNKKIRNYVGKDLYSDFENVAGDEIPDNTLTEQK